jgi:NAD(P)H dehydrogenase (quinone)
MSYIVTASTGQLGGRIVDSLLALGVDPKLIIATGRDDAKLKALSGKPVKSAILDYTKPETVGAVVRPGDTLMLVSGDAVGQRVAQHSAVIAAAKEAGVGRILYTSAPKATTSALILAPEHKATEELLAASGIPHTILRNGWYTENYLPQAEKGAATGEIVGSAAGGRVSSASRKDYADAAAVAILDETLNGRVFELSGDYAWNFDELAAAIGQIAGRDVSYRNLGQAEHVEYLTNAGLDAGTAGFRTALDANIRDGLLGHTSGDLARLTGRPTTPLVDGLRAAIR